MKYKNRLISNDIDKKGLISSSSTEDCEIMVLYDEDPYEYLSGDIAFQRIDQNKYLIQPPYSYEKLSKWLYYGNWQVVSPAISSYEFIDSFRSSPEKIQNHLNNHKVDLMIDSFHDNIEWNVFRKG